ncbi:MAG TPA: hypothetical protein VGH10_03690 [Actinomycetota bacterium]|jgi:hypothetical protein
MPSRVKLAVLTAMAVSLAVVVAGAVVPARATATTAGASTSRSAVRLLRIYYTPPILVRAGERVRFPVDVVCATAAGRACAATLTASAATGASGAWRSVTVGATPDLLVDLSAAASRAIGEARAARADTGTSTDVVRFALSARAQGRSSALGFASEEGALRFYVTDSLPSLRVPDRGFGPGRHGRTVLFLPWGSGPLRAGLAPGSQSPTLGPSSFDVDARGRVYLLDQEQARLAVFLGGRLVRQAPVSVPPPADLAVGPRGRAWILSRAPGSSDLVVRAIDPNGSVGSPIPVDSQIVGQIRMAGGRPFVHAFPLDAWVPVDAGASRPAAPLTTGMPVGGSRSLLGVVTEASVRLGTVAGDAVSDAVELRFPAQLGELALSAPDGHGGYWAVQHVSRDRPAADAYDVVHVAGDRLRGAFEIAGGGFALTAPLSRFRLGADGALYELRTSPAGLRIVRFDIGGAS